MKTYGNSLNWNEYSGEIVEKLKMYPFLKWQNLKTQRLAKKLFNQGYPVSDAIGIIIVNA